MRIIRISVLAGCSWPSPWGRPWPAAATRRQRTPASRAGTSASSAQVARRSGTPESRQLCSARRHIRHRDHRPGRRDGHLDDPTLGACNDLSWGYTTTGSGNTVLGGKPYGCFTETEAETTVGPFATAVVLRVFLTDHTCANTTYYSDGDHAITTPSSPTSWDVDIADAGGFCERQNIPVVFVPPGNLSVDVVINP